MSALSESWALWVHPLHLGSVFAPGQQGQNAGAGSIPSSLAVPKPLLLHDQLTRSGQAPRADLPQSAQIAAGSAVLAVDLLAGAQANPKLAEAVSFMRQVKVSIDPEGALLRLALAAEDSSAGWAVDVQLLGAEVSHQALDPEVGGFAIAVVPCTARTSASMGRGLPPTAADAEMFPAVAADIGTWLFVFDGDEISLVSALDVFSMCGAIRTGLESSFRLTDRALGSGGCATVYVAQGISSGSFGAIKLSREAGSKADRSLTHEVALAVAAQGHPNVIRFLGLFRHDSFAGSTTPYCWAAALELCPGGDLQQRVARIGPHPEGDVGPILRGALTGLSHVHERGVVHRDVKSENILLKEGLHPIITDFGVAAFASDLQAMSCRCGSAGYVAPEVLRAEKPYDCKVDVFGIGVTMYFMMSARLPFAGKDVAQVLRRNMRCQVDLQRDYYLQHSGAPAKDFLRSLMQANPHDRPSSAEALRHEWWKAPQDAQDADSRGSTSVPMSNDLCLVPVPPPTRASEAPRPPPRRGVANKTQPAQPVSPSAPGRASQATMSHPTPQKPPQTPRESKGPPAPAGPAGKLAMEEAAAVAAAESATRASSNRGQPPLPTLGNEDAAVWRSKPYTGGDDEDPQERKSLGMRPTICKRLHGAIAAGIGLSRAPNFELSMERMSHGQDGANGRANRRFRLMNESTRDLDGGGFDRPQLGLSRRARLGSGQSLLSMGTDDDDDGLSDRGWHSFGRATDASGLNTPRTTFGGRMSVESSRSDFGSTFMGRMSWNRNRSRDNNRDCSDAESCSSRGENRLHMRLKQKRQMLMSRATKDGFGDGDERLSFGDRPAAADDFLGSGEALFDDAELRPMSPLEDPFDSDFGRASGGGGGGGPSSSSSKGPGAGAGGGGGAGEASGQWSAEAESLRLNFLRKSTNGNSFSGAVSMQSSVSVDGTERGVPPLPSASSSASWKRSARTPAVAEAIDEGRRTHDGSSATPRSPPQGEDAWRSQLRARTYATGTAGPGDLGADRRQPPPQASSTPSQGQPQRRVADGGGAATARAGESLRHLQKTRSVEFQEAGDNLAAGGQVLSVLPPTQVASTAKASAVSAASACAEAIQSTNTGDPATSSKSRRASSKSTEPSAERTSFTRSLRGRLGSLVAKKWLASE